MKNIILHGVPYVLKDINAICMYGTSLQIGFLSEDKKSVVYSEGWEKLVEAYKKEYQLQLKEKTAASMHKAAEQFKGHQ